MVPSNNFFKSRLFFYLTKKQSFVHLHKKFTKNILGYVLSVWYLIPGRDGLKLKNFTGVCLAFFSSGLYSTILLRNSFKSMSVELKLPIYSPSFLNFKFNYMYRKNLRLKKLYFLRSFRKKHFI